MTKHQRFFPIYTHSFASRYYDEVTRQCEDFLVTVQGQKFIDCFESSAEEKIKQRVHTFRIRGPFSETRYPNASVLSSSFFNISQAKKGVVVPRKKLVDYYMVAKQDRQTENITLEFNVLGHGAHAKRIGKVPIHEIETKQSLNSFFQDAARMMVALKPVLESKANDFEMRLQRLKSAQAFVSI